MNVCVSHASKLKRVTMKLARLQPWMVIFLPLLTVRVLSAFYSNISDCDETFNYWEPVRAPHTLAPPRSLGHYCSGTRCSCTRIEVHASRPPLQLHYLLHGTGFQTWEYSPVHGIRSYAYIALHSLPLIPFTGLAKVLQHYSDYVSVVAWVCGCVWAWLDLCMILFTINLGMVVQCSLIPTRGGGVGLMSSPYGGGGDKAMSKLKL